MRNYVVLQTTRVCPHCGPALHSALVSTEGEIPRQPWACALCGCADGAIPAWAVIPAKTQPRKKRVLARVAGRRRRLLEQREGLVSR